MKKFFIITLLLSTFIFMACYDRVSSGDRGAIDKETKLKGDRTIYGLACDGCSDSVIVFLPNEGGDPVRYNIVNAQKNHQVFGDIGTMVGHSRAVLNAFVCIRNLEV